MQRWTISAKWLPVTLSILMTISILAACRPVNAPRALPAGSAAAAAAPEVAGVAPTPVPAQDWARIQAAGHLVVGTAADYAPFEFYNADFELDGFDVALLRAIGAKLGIDVTFKDIAFEGIPAALDVGQIDVAVAAITMTPERTAVVDFSIPYFASQEGYLVRPTAQTGSITSLESLSDQRIGVQRGTTYETWLRQLLVEPGILSAQNLIVYTTIDEAVADLQQDRIDIIVTDLPAAQSLARANNLKLITKGLFDQQYALAVRTGSDELRSQLDRALAELQKDGTVARLAKQYLDLEPDQLVLPAATSQTGGQTTPAKAAPACLDSLAFVQDLTLPDQDMASPAVTVPGQSFTKSWRVQNTGTCPWTTAYALRFAYGNAPGASMGGQPVAITQTVPAGGTYDFTVDLVAPIASGVYQGFWQLHNAAGEAFGESLHVGIQVAGAPTPTPAPTQTPVPGIAFSADTSNIQQGKPVTLSWAVQDAKAVYFYIAGQDWKDKTVEATGSATDIPATTTTYQLRVVRNDGQEETRDVTVYVEPVPGLPQIDNFSVAPEGEVTIGQCLSLNWQISGNVEKVSLFRDKDPIWDNAPVEGTFEDCPKQPGSYTYAIGASGTGGVNYSVVSVDVVAGKATPVPPGPAIDRFSVLPEAVEVNGCVEAKWTVGGDVTTIRVLRDDVVLLDNAPRTGSGSDCLTEAGSHRYRLEATNDQGQQASAEVLVTVGASTPTPTAIPPTPLPPIAGEAAAGDAAQIVGQALILISYRDVTGALTPPLTGTKITAKFEQDGQLSGFAGCNTYTSSYQAGSNQSLTLGPIATTMKSCTEPIGIMDQEAHYLNSLQTAASFKTEVGQLTLQDGAGNPVAIFVANQ